MTEKELEKIYNEAYRAVYWTAFSLLRNEADAEDIVQDTFVSLINSYDSIKDKTKLLPWLKKVAANKSLNRLTRTKTDNVEDEFFDSIETVPEDFLPDSIVESAETRKIIMDIIDNSLSEDVRRTLILFYFDEMSTKEIAEALGVPEGTVSWRIHSAKKKIKKEVEKYEKDNDTKLFMVVPFLTKLFTKEAEQVAIKPMSAALKALSASTAAVTVTAGSKLAAHAIKKGTGIMVKKIIIICAAVLAVGGVTAGIIYKVTSDKQDHEVSVKHKDRDRDKDEDIETEEDANAGTKETEDAGTRYLIDVTDKEELKALIEGAIACEPETGECNDDVMDKLNAVFTPLVDRYGWYGEDVQLYFRYDPCIDDEHENMDHVEFIGYSGYETEDVDGEDYILSYEKVYAHEERPGIATIWIQVYDEDRAYTCWNNINEYLSMEMFPDATIDTSWEDRYQLLYGPDEFDWYAVITIKPLGEECWVICAEITLANPAMFVEDAASSESGE